MADEQYDSPQAEAAVKTPAPASSGSATPASNQNLILGLVMGAVLLLLILFFLGQYSGGFNLSGNPSGKDDPSLSEIRRELDDAQRERDAARDAVLGLPGGQDGNVLISNIQRDAEALTQFLTASQAELSRLRGSEVAQQDLYAKLGALQTDLAQARGAQAQLAGVQAQLQAANARIQQLSEQLASSIDNGTAQRLRDRIAGIQEERESLRQQLAQARADQAGMVDADQLTEFQKLIPENRRLRAELQELRSRLDSAKNLFVTRDNLSPVASRLFSELVRLEGNDRSGLNNAYRRLEQDMDARVMETAGFATGSSALKSEHEDHIKNVIAASPEGAFFLVVGYASKSGDNQSNRELSRKRSIRTASVVNYLKRSGQKVQAVYLGETSRFGPDNRSNQVCEVWEIRP